MIFQVKQARKVLKLIFLNTIIFCCAFSSSLNAATWVTCGTGTWGDNAGSTTLRISNDGGTTCINPYSATFATNDFLDFASGQIITIAANIAINPKINVRVYGSIIFDNGKLNLQNSASTIVMYSGSTLTCTGGCGSSDQISVGAYNYKGGDLDVINNAPRPSTVDNTGTVLPISLISFSASKKGETSIKLVWATASELNFHYFDVQRASTDLNFLGIGQVEGNGTTNLHHDYSFTDEFPLIGKNYYRLKSVDFDGHTEYFKIIAVDFSGDKQFQLSPNPSDGLNIKAKTNFIAAEKGSVIVYDNVGSVVGRFELEGNESEFNFSDKLKAGTYFAKFSTDGFTKVARFLVRE